MQKITNRISDEVTVIRIENDWLSVDTVPDLGGKISGLYNKRTNHEFLWRNQALKLRYLPLGSEYDPNFYGGIYELLPNDILEALDDIEYPDHGELWTTRLKHELAENKITVYSKLKLSGLVAARVQVSHIVPCFCFILIVIYGIFCDRRSSAKHAPVIADNSPELQTTI